MVDDKEIKTKDTQEKNELETGTGNELATGAPEEKKESRGTSPKKFSMVETILALLITGAVDLANMVADALAFVPFVGMFFFGIAWMLDAIFAIATVLWLFIIKGERGLYRLGQNMLGSTSPGIPIRTLALAFTIYLANHPKSIASKAIGLEERKGVGGLKSAASRGVIGKAA